MYPARENEPGYARLNDPACQTHNRYGKPIETVAPGDPRHGRSLTINGDPAIGANPNRYKQHGFHFNADNCIACHACEAACSEKNGNPAHLAFRSVGFIEGGSYPNATRINISLACNHCDNPVCLKGCPTRAYTKFAEYGAVLQDPDICFGCGYCTWVCPYNAPQFDPVKGQVSKCNLCVDRLEVGLKPACVASCLGKALDFGVIENVPQGRTQAKVEIPGFPSPEITHPNVRFQQTRALARDMARADSVPLKYHRDEASGAYRPSLDPKQGFKRAWNLGKLLGSHENAHIVFTLAFQAVAGAFLLLILGGAFAPLAGLDGGPARLPSLLAMLALLGAGMFKLNMHLGKPHYFYRGFYNLKHSPVSREIAGVSAFFAGLAGYTLFTFFDGQWAASARMLCAALGIGGIVFGGYYMIRLYRIPARPYWNHWHTDAAFSATAFTLGPLLLAVAALFSDALNLEAARFLVGVAALGLIAEGVALFFHARDQRGQESEAAASHHEQRTAYGGPYLLRNVLLGVSLLLALNLASSGEPGGSAILLLAVPALASAILGRALFYVLVIPTTLPGAFFWRNPGFAQHARETGLADMPQLGVAYPRHHRFRFGALRASFQATNLAEKFAQLRRVFTG